MDIKKNKDENQIFGITMGEKHGAEICDLEVYTFYRD